MDKDLLVNAALEKLFKLLHVKELDYTSFTEGTNECFRNTMFEISEIVCGLRQALSLIDKLSK